MSSELLSPEPGGPASPPPTRSFRSLATGVVAALALVAGGLTVANAVQGPGVVRADVDPVRASSLAGQRWVLDLDQAPVVDSIDVRLTPEVPVEVGVADRRVTVKLGRPLDLGTTYALHVTMTGASTHGVSRITETVTTPPAQTFLLQRGGVFGGGADDQVLRTDLPTGRQDVVYRGHGIQQVASAAPYLAVIEADGDAGHAVLSTVRLGSDGKPVQVVDGTGLQQLRSSGDAGLFAYVVDGNTTDEPHSELHVLDPATGRTGTVLGTDGQPIDPTDWRFVPGTNQLVVQTPSLQVYLVDPWNRTAVKPLGGHPYLVDFMPGTRDLVVDDQHDTQVVLDLATGQRSDLPAPTAPPGRIVYAALTRPTSLPPATLLTRVDASGVTTEDLELAIGTGEQRLTLWQNQPGTTLARTCQSPNGQLVELDLVPAGGVGDEYPIVPGSTGAQAVVVDLSTGMTHGPYAGSLSTWCH